MIKKQPFGGQTVFSENNYKLLNVSHYLERIPALTTEVHADFSTWTFKDNCWSFLKVKRFFCNVVILPKSKRNINVLKSIGPCAFY